MKYLSIILVALFTTIAVQADDNYSIEFKVDGISEENAILAYYYMDKKYVRDTVEFDEEGHAVYSGNDTIDSGVYLLAFPSMGFRYFELILGEEDAFSMETDTADLVNNMVVKGSLENQLFYENLKFLTEKGRESKAISDAMKGKPEATPEHQAAIDQLIAIEDEIAEKRRELVRKHGDTFYGKITKAMMDVEIPDNPNPADSAFAYRYLQEHFLDNIDLTDPRMSRTPFLLRRITSYLEDYTIPHPDSIIIAADRVIEASMENYEMFQFCLVGIFNKYAKSKIMSHEKVYVHLAKKYYLSGKADWISQEQYDKFQERLTKMEPTLLGKIAPNIIISDYYGDTRRMDVESGGQNYIVLVFWNSGCGHCKKEMPILKSLHDSLLVDMGNVKIMAISTELETDEWKTFIDEHDLFGEKWINAHDAEGRNPFRYKYDVQSTPLILVLAPNMEILAKRISDADIVPLIKYDMGKRKE